MVYGTARNCRGRKHLPPAQDGNFSSHTRYFLTTCTTFSQTFLGLGQDKISPKALHTVTLTFLKVLKKNRKKTYLCEALDGYSLVTSESFFLVLLYTRRWGKFSKISSRQFKKKNLHLNQSVFIFFGAKKMLLPWLPISRLSSRN